MLPQWVSINTKNILEKCIVHFARDKNTKQDYNMITVWPGDMYEETYEKFYEAYTCMLIFHAICLVIPKPSSKICVTAKHFIR